MSEVEGKLLVCDVCGKTVFLKYVGDGKGDVLARVEHRDEIQH